MKARRGGEMSGGRRGAGGGPRGAQGGSEGRKRGEGRLTGEEQDGLGNLVFQV